jgi:hypothetical protein
MRTLRILAALLMTSLLTLALAGTAAAQTPQGQGLTTLANEGISALSCDDPTITESNVILTRGGGPATFVADGRMYLLRSIAVSGTVTTPDVAFPVAFSKTFGNKAGLTDVVTCTFEQVLEEDGAVFEGSGTVVLVQTR